MSVEENTIKVSLKWLKCLGQAFPVYYNNPKYGDISVHSEGRILSVNSLVLASQSTCLKDIVESKKAAILLEETLMPFCFESVDCFFYGLYTGDLDDLDFYSMMEVFRICAMFKVAWMEESCLKWLCENTAKDNLIHTISLGIEYDNESLITCSDKLFSKTPLFEVTEPSSEEWLDLNLEVIVHVLSLSNLCLVCEIDAFVYALSWVEKNITYSNKEMCQGVFECIRLYSLPHEFRETFVYSYISLLSQKLLLALKYPQMNRWKIKAYPPRENIQIGSDEYLEFSILVEHSVTLVDLDYNKTFTDAGISVYVTINFTKLEPLIVSLETDKNIEQCYAWFKSEGTEIFPLGANSVVCGENLTWQNFDVVQTRRLFCSGRVRIGFMLYIDR